MIIPTSAMWLGSAWAYDTIVANQRSESFWGILGEAALFLKGAIRQGCYFFQSLDFIDLECDTQSCCSHLRTMMGRPKDKSQELRMVEQKEKKSRSS